MFTGIIQATGIVDRIERRAGTARITVHAPDFARTVRVGDSVAVNGTCLTAVGFIPSGFSADLAAETLRRTTFETLQTGSVVNLELPTAAGAPLGGHIVQGHVDGRGEVLSSDAVDRNANPMETDWWLRLSLPENTRRFMVEKGSVAIEGISLTIAGWDGAVCEIAVLPHTRNVTNLRTARPGDPINVEADVITKLALSEQKVRHPRIEVTLEYLLENGY
ncbi:MAG: riboflavin synthase [Acidobacteriaceae bacterium]